MAQKALIVLAHPATQSLSRLFSDDAAAALKSRGVDVTVLDLYASGFAAALTTQERAGYYGGQPSHDGIEDHARLLTESETLVLIFPTWWFGLPAILKGWIDRVFAPGVAFDHADNFGPIKPRLTALRTCLLYTSPSPRD